MALALAILYNTVTNMAGIYISSDLGGSTQISVYPMVFFGLGNVLTLPLTQLLADRLGAIKLLVYGLLFYTLFSFLCSLAPTFVIFNIFRFGLGLSSGVFFVLCRRILLVFSTPEKAEKLSFLMALSYAVLPVIGASFGAWLAYESFWRWIFHVNTLISLPLAAYFWIFFRHTDEKIPHPFTDKIGYFFFTLGIGSIVTALTVAQELDWLRSPTFVILMLIGLPSFFFFILWELKHPNPLINLKLLKNPILAFSLLNLAVLFSSYFGMIILITLWLNIYVNYTPLWIALLIGIMAIAGVVAYFVKKFFLNNFDARHTLAFAILCFALSCYYSTYFNIETDFFHLAVARFLSG
ncbi:MAG: MFS transporter, partial [Chlamydiota bacterium]